MLPSNTVGRVIGKYGPKIKLLETKKQSKNSDKTGKQKKAFIISGPLTSINSTLEKIKSITQCRYRDYCNYNANRKFSHEQIDTTYSAKEIRDTPVDFTNYDDSSRNSTIK